ncbi:histidine phosphatase family protein [Mucilaginibacter conchicola]|uniref:Histidine phosphatase family protein n=1 Tax=Mucilaginibacter conchicola TaxID=2303333 RepID=A0A372NU63_9SPHI|nr:histidine phosphatase family protein [Mucilaginibacter conchicola]RFZ92813.1 histidine phosphatase family protein [Mucilaginibacter conchicola]
MVNIKFSLRILLLCLAFGFYGQRASAQQDLKVIIIRHAEKPVVGDNLSCAGFDRAMKLPAVIKAKFGVPNYLYVPAPNTGKATKALRMLQTISPLAVKYNLPLNTNYDVTQTAKLANNIMKRQGTVLVVWEHDNIRGIIDAFGIKTKKLKWAGNDFDGIWIVTFHNGSASLSVDKENIQPVANCAF